MPNPTNTLMSGLGSGLGAGAGQAASSLITGLFQSGVTNAQKDLINAQKAKIEQDTRLDVLSNSQKQQLAEQMAAAQSDSDRERLIATALSNTQVASINAIATIKAAQAQVALQQSQSSSQTQLFVFGGLGLVLIIGVFILLKKD